MIQIDSDVTFVSETPYHHVFDRLNNFHHPKQK